jgi:hypothetical protein
MAHQAINLDGSKHQGADYQDTEQQGIDPGSVESIWNKETMDRVVTFSVLLDDIAVQREALNANKKAGITGLINDGFNQDALEMAIKYSKTPEAKRENFDLTYQFARKALGMPMQDDLFAAAMQEQVKVSTTKKKEKIED